jgi:hypothetical protein
VCHGAFKCVRGMPATFTNPGPTVYTGHSLVPPQVLNGNKDAHSWMRHVAGAARLIEVRGAHRFDTEFEMALFMAHVGPTVSVSDLLNH